MAKITCVGQICSFIHSHLGSQGLQKKAAACHVTGGRALRSGRRGQGQQRSHSEHGSFLSSEKGSWDLTLGKFPECEACPWAGCSPRASLSVPDPPQSRPVTYPHARLCSSDVRHWFFPRETMSVALGNPNSMGISLCMCTSKRWTCENPSFESFPSLESRSVREQTNGLTLLFPTIGAREAHLPMKYLKPPSLEVEKLSNLPVLGMQYPWGLRNQQRTERGQVRRAGGGSPLFPEKQF